MTVLVLFFLDFFKQVQMFKSNKVNANLDARDTFHFCNLIIWSNSTCESINYKRSKYLRWLRLTNDTCDSIYSTQAHHVHVFTTHFDLFHPKPQKSYLGFVNQPSQAFWLLVKLATRLQLLESRASNSRRAPLREVGFHYYVVMTLVALNAVFSKFTPSSISCEGHCC